MFPYSHWNATAYHSHKDPFKESPPPLVTMNGEDDTIRLIVEKLDKTKAILIVSMQKLTERGSSVKYIEPKIEELMESSKEMYTKIARKNRCKFFCL